jgi:hypothetical protein
MPYDHVLLAHVRAHAKPAPYLVYPSDEDNVKVDMTGASAFVNRMFEACGPYQWAREFLKNAQEAGASRVEFGIEWQAVQKGIYRRTVADDGCGMDRHEIVRYFSKLGEGAKPIGGIHDNFGVGAKVASLPWNPHGVVVMSWKDGQGSMIWIRLDEESGDYELVEFQDEKRRTVVVDPAVVNWPGMGEVDWGLVKPGWIDDHGTVIVLLGSEGHEDTVLGDPAADEAKLKGLSLYLNTRFWDLRDIEVHIAELKNEIKTGWPKGPDGKGAELYQRRRAQGAVFYLTEVNAKAGRLIAADNLPVDEDRVSVDWYLWEGERPHIGPYARKGGYIALRYNGELFHVSSSKVHFRWFGIIESEVQHRTTIILEPKHYGQGSGKWGVHPDQSRNRLIFSGGGERGVDVPLSDWGQMFADEMPVAIREAVMAARGDSSAEIQDEEYRRRLQDKFGNRWRTRRLVVSTTTRPHTEPASPQDEDEEVPPVIEVDTNRFGVSRSKRGRAVQVLRKRAVAGGDGVGEPMEAPVDVPRIGFRNKDDFEKPWHLAMWAPNDPDGPTVHINVDSGILQEVVEYHQEMYPEIYQEEVAKIVRQVFGEVAACKIAHSQKLSKEVPEQELDQDYRSEAALTVGLMGLIAEESLIAQRLGRLGPKKS